MSKPVENVRKNRGNPQGEAEKRARLKHYWRLAYPQLWDMGMRPPSWMRSVEVARDDMASRGVGYIPGWLARASAEQDEPCRCRGRGWVANEAKDGRPMHRCMSWPCEASKAS